MPPTAVNMPFSTCRLCVLTLLLLGAILFVFEPAQAEPITIYTTELDGHHQPDLRGKYDQIVLSAAQDRKLTAEFKFLPPARAIRLFLNCTDCCVSPCNSAPDISHCPGGTLSDIWDKVELHAFNLVSDQFDGSIDNLKTLRVGAIQGMPLGAEVEANLTTIRRLETPQAAIDMLGLGRLDVFLGWIPETLVYFKENGIPSPMYNAKQAVKSVPIGIACKGPESLQLIDAVNAYLRQTPVTSDAVPVSPSNPDG